jgi:hypothetical protein
MFKIDVDVPQHKSLVSVKTTHNRGFNAEEVSKDCVSKLISVSDSTHPAIREQANAYKSQMERIVAYYMREAIRSDRTTVYNALIDAGHPKLAELIRRL